MNENNEFLAGVLRQTNRALAGYASRDLIEKYPQAAEGFEPDPFAAWQTWLAVRVEELAAAIATGRPQLFISQVHWAKELLKARGISPESFRHGLARISHQPWDRGFWAGVGDGGSVT